MNHAVKGFAELILLAGCARGQLSENGASEKSSIVSGQGSIDSSAWDALCKLHQAPPGCDLCEQLGWYGDAVCDSFCPQTDPDCSSSCTPGCSSKTCGADGCGGTCGTCATSETCSANGQCLSADAFSITSPADNTTVSGTLEITGVAGAKWQNFIAWEGDQKIAADVPNINGSFTLDLDTTQLPNGLLTIDVLAFDALQGQAETDRQTLQLTVNVSNDSVTSMGGAIPDAPLANYRLVWSQDFTTMQSLSVSGGYTLNGATWIAHLPTHQDYSTFIDPVSNYNPFGIGDGQLTIRASQRGYGDPNNWFGGYSTGTLSANDDQRNGFAQQYGYFEASMWLPGGRNTWPGIWLMGWSGAEIDIIEEYGNWGPASAPDPDYYTSSLHDWANDVHDSDYVREPGMTAGYHQFGVDVEPDYIVFYYDRSEIWRSPTREVYKSPLYPIITLALGGATYNNAAGDGYDWSLTPDPSDLKVEYVAVWASPSSPNY